ncbi:hypothetical protein HYV30_00185 [Candidatus Kaiserbacteria bacterium]|nr:hypothetical protein [Candidatus Kaiserbacteria bacterium]
MTNAEAGEAIKAFLEKLGVNLEYVRLCEDGDVQLKTHRGFKVVIRNRKRGGRVIFC